MIRISFLKKRYRPETQEEEWALVSRKKPFKVLKWFGTKKPTHEEFLKEERRVQFFKHRHATLSYNLSIHGAREGLTFKRLYARNFKKVYGCLDFYEDGNRNLYLIRIQRVPFLSKKVLVSQLIQLTGISPTRIFVQPYTEKIPSEDLIAQTYIQGGTLWKPLMPPLTGKNPFKE